MENRAVAALLVVAIIAGAGVGYFVGSKIQPAQTLTVTTPSVTTTSTLTTTYYSDPGTLLRLQVRLNSTSVRSGGAISATIALLNPLGINFSVIPGPLTNSTIRTWNEHDLICGGNEVNLILGYALFRGHFASNNLSSAGNPLTLAPPIHPPCPAFPTADVFVFFPHSDTAFAFTSTELLANLRFPPARWQVALNATTFVCAAAQGGGFTCGGGEGLYGHWGLYGYWNVTGPSSGFTFDNATVTSKFFHYLQPGQYTLAVEASWGQQVFEYFEVHPT